MSDYEEIKRISEAAVGFSDISLAPDVVIALIDERSQLRQMTSSQENVIKIGHKTQVGQREAIKKLQMQIQAMEKDRDAIIKERDEATLHRDRLIFDLDLLHKKNEALSAKLV